MTDDEVLDYISNEVPDAVFDEMRNKNTLDADTVVEIKETA